MTGIKALVLNTDKTYKEVVLKEETDYYIHVNAQWLTCNPFYDHGVVCYTDKDRDSKVMELNGWSSFLHKFGLCTRRGLYGSILVCGLSVDDIDTNISKEFVTLLHKYIDNRL